MATNVRMYVLRHGQTVADGVFYGHDDVALHELGRKQAEAQAEALRAAGLVAIWSSDLARARIGAELVAEPYGLSVRTSPALREMALGVLEGVRYDAALRRMPELAGRSYHDMLDVRFPGGGESVRDVAVRVHAWLDVALEELAVATEHETSPAVALVAHNTVARLLLARAVGAGPQGYIRFEQRYGAINRIDLPVRSGAAEQRVDWGGASIAYANRDPLGWRRPP